MTGVFATLGISKNDIELFFSVLLTAANFYWAARFNSLKFNDQMNRSLKDQNEMKDKEIKTLKHKVLVMEIKKRKEEGASKGLDQPLA